MMSNKFGPGDKIFAKVRGYPPWPARVEGVADETPNKMKYHVYFYGTGETAICKQEELFSYVDNREKFGKPIKKKGFTEALMQMDSELGIKFKPTPSKTASKPEGITEDSDHEGNLVIDEAPSSNKKPKTASAALNTSVSSNKGKEAAKRRKAGADESEEGEPAAKKRTMLKRSSLVTSNEDSPNSSLKPNTPEVISRSGRKIKPKKFADDEVDSQASDDSELPNQGTKTSASRQSIKGNKGGGEQLVSSSNGPHSDATEDMEVDAEIINDGTLVAWTPNGQEVRLKLNLNRPATFKTEKARINWETNVIKDGKRLKAQIESGEILPESVKKEIQEKYQDRLIQLEQKMSCDDKKEKLAYLKIEAQLLDVDVRIKGSLSLKQADPESCLRYLEELLELKISPLMVKKHPEVVDTVKKLRKYVGNTSTWNMTEEESHIFASKAGSIRAKSEHVYNKIKSMFLVPYGKSFWDIFAQELTEFHKNTKGLSVEEVFSLTVDPTEKKDENVLHSESADMDSLENSKVGLV